MRRRQRYRIGIDAYEYAGEFVIVVAQSTFDWQGLAKLFDLAPEGASVLNICRDVVAFERDDRGVDEMWELRPAERVLLADLHQRNATQSAKIRPTPIRPPYAISAFQCSSLTCRYRD